MANLSLQDAQKALLPLSIPQRLKVFILEHDKEVIAARQASRPLPAGAVSFLEDKAVNAFIQRGYPRPPAGPQPIDPNAKYLPVGRTKEDLGARLRVFAPSTQQRVVGFSAAFAAAALACELGTTQGKVRDEILLRASWLAVGPVAAWAIAWPIMADRTQGLRLAKQAVWPLIGLNYGQIFDGLALRGPQVRYDTVSALPAYALICGLPLMMEFLPTPIEFKHGKAAANMVVGILSSLYAAAICSVGLGFDLQARGSRLPDAASMSAGDNASVDLLKMTQMGCQLVSALGVLTLGTRLATMPRSSQANHDRIDGFQGVALTISMASLVGAGLLVNKMVDTSVAG